MSEAKDPQSPSATWRARVTQFWETVDDERPGEAWQELEKLLAELPAGDAASLFERASLHDFLGDESAAIPLYREALAAGLHDERHGYAVIQLASSLRNGGDAAEAIRLLEPICEDDRLGGAARAFLALALHDVGRVDAALGLVLTDLAATLPLYGRAIREYAAIMLDNGDASQAG